ncbi:hypothetical protein [Sinomonas atrocyanea]
MGDAALEEFRAQSPSVVAVVRMSPSTREASIASPFSRSRAGSS